MIEINNGHAKIAGARYEIISDTATLFESLLKYSPEILIACITSYDEELKTSLSKANPLLMKMLVDIIDSIHKENK